MPSTVTRPASHAIIGAAPLCRKCNAHRDSNIHLAQYAYSGHHAYEGEDTRPQWVKDSPLEVQDAFHTMGAPKV